ncbi:hydroxyacylglutathione hydrolase-like protein isoform X3 [Calonectris borealis]|uniref:hydroxyacylglutathione hydrolase-like protein isoform X3 n=1 Tax=Calonectris borealis TaxID=1323832 RepID=UPI003F4BCD0D
MGAACSRPPALLCATGLGVGSQAFVPPSALAAQRVFLSAFLCPGLLGLSPAERCRTGQILLWDSCWKSSGRRTWCSERSSPPTTTGDTLFVGGCGKFFEGTAEQMYANLTQILGALPKETKVFCGHECTVRNLKFALKVEPENEIVKKKLAWAKQRDDEDLPTVPSTLQEEFLYNPFLRVTEEPLQKFTGKTDPVEVLRTLRTEKDNFKKPKERPNPQAMLAFDWGLFSPFLEKQ